MKNDKPASKKPKYDRRAPSYKERMAKKEKTNKDDGEILTNDLPVKEEKIFEEPWFFASCPRDVEYLLEAEINKFKPLKVRTEPGGVAFQSPIETAFDVLLNSRVASRVFKEIQIYSILSEKDLYSKAKDKWWDKIFYLNQTFKINTLFDRETKDNFNNSLIFSQILKDAIVDNFREKFGERPSVNTERPDITFLLRVEKKTKSPGYNARILVDMCGEPISNRGYRVDSLKAPLRENLAAAILQSTDFDPSRDIFTDCMCGTGTLLIEAILMKAEISPTYLKIRKYIERKIPVFDFIKHPWHTADKKAVRMFDEKAIAVYNHSLKALNELETRQFFGFDISERALETTRLHLKNCMIDPQIVTLNKRDATKITPMDPPPGIVICNPPYGERMGEEEELRKLYRDLGENFKHNWKGYRAYVFTSNPLLRKSIELQTSKRFTFHNGSIECRLLRYELR
jgi:23S rRNA G2445 N2-methylase RlmL